MPWQDALRTVLELTYDTVQKEGLAWTVVGSGATALQGCRVLPHDLEIITEKPASVFRFAELLTPFTPEGDDTSDAPREPCRSTRKAPVFVGPHWGLDWHYASWDIVGTKFEVVHIVAPGGHPGFRDGGVWECDPAIWTHLRRVPFDGYSVPVVPLEIQVETNLARGRTDSGEDLFYRVAEIARVFRANGYDRALLEWALRPAHLARFDRIMHGQ